MNDGSLQRLYVLGAKPRERKLPLEPDFDIEVDRRIYCRHYGTCLDYAFVKKWVSWSCGNCPIVEKINVEELRQQAFEISKVLLSEL